MKYVTRTQAIENFLKAKSPLGHLYSREFECQVNVAQDGGSVVDGEYKGRQWRGFTDGATTWKSFRIPYGANKNPTYDDPVMTWDLAAHVEGIGMTGWNWVKRESHWVAFDFDAITGHSDKHSSKLTPEQLELVREKAQSIPWVTVRRSTSGGGLHLYVFLEKILTENHTEHAALGRAILGMMSAEANFDFLSKVDICGGNMWVWHRKMTPNGFELIKEGENLLNIPANWRDHVKVITGKKRKVLPAEVKEIELDSFDQCVAQFQYYELEETHRKHIQWVAEHSSGSYWNQDQRIWVTHTYWLAQLHDHFQLTGIFKTDATGTEQQTDKNCFCRNLPNGAWEVRRFGQGVKEDISWDQDSSGYTRCYFNRQPDLAIAARSYGGIEHPKGGYVFGTVEEALFAAKSLGVYPDVLPWTLKHPAKLMKHKDGRLIFEIDRQKITAELPGWLVVKDNYVKVFNANTSPQTEPDTQNYDDLIRHLVTESNEDQGWVVKSDEAWRSEPLVHIKSALSALGVKGEQSTISIGSCIFKPWTVVNRPFQPEYLLDRQWNRNAAQLRYTPSGEEILTFPTWSKILKHVGAGLDEAVSTNPWCQYNGIKSGADYLKCWIASLFQAPMEPLPYLFLYGPQNSGKSILHEALNLLITHGVRRADQALTSPSAFNGELENAVLCIIEETDLKNNKVAYNRIKDWVTSNEIPIHRKYDTPYTIPNTTHWIQCSNEASAVPVFPGDTRITMIYVGEIDPLEMEPKRSMIPKLEKEAPDFIAELLRLEIPESPDRLNVPIIETAEKILSQKNNQTALETFLDEKCAMVEGYWIRLSEFVSYFHEWLDPSEVQQWTTRRVGKDLPSRFVKGRNPKDCQVIIGNIVMLPFDFSTVENRARLVLKGDKLVPEA